MVTFRVALIAGGVLALSCAMGLGAGCSSAEKNFHLIKRVRVDSLKVRRPLAPSADPKAGPGGVDYRSDPLPDGNFDCRSWDSLFDELDLDAVMRCVHEVTEPSPVRYRFRRQASPSLELLEAGKAPRCFRELLSVLPMPREIVFRDSHGDCYASRVDLSADEALGFKLPTKRWDLEVHLPLESPPQDRAALKRLLAAWVMTPFWNAEKGGIPSKFLPERLCKLCIGDSEASQDLPDELRRFWPE